MKQKRVTYGVKGMMEFHTVIHFGKAFMRISFTDGFVSGIGESPAIFTTDNFIVQQAIERSDEFKSGRIKKIKSYELKEELPIVNSQCLMRHSQKRMASEESMDKGPKVKVKGPKPETPEPEIEEPETQEAEAPDVPEPEIEEESEQEETAESGLLQVAVSGNDEAREYMQRNFDTPISHMRTRAAISAVALQEGIEFVYGK